MAYLDEDILYDNIEEKYRVAKGAARSAYSDVLDTICEMPRADVVPKREDGAECPTCYGTGRIKTTDWLTKKISKEQLAKEKAEAIAEHELHIKQDYAREIFEEIEREINDALQSNYKVLPIIEESEALWNRVNGKIDALRGIDGFLDELKEKYTEELVDG